MKLTLDHTQRLNLHALLGAQRADVGAIRVIWAVQDKIALGTDEEQALELKREFEGGHERVVWNPLLSVPPQTWDSYGVNVDRCWLQPIIEALFSNGLQILK